MVRHWPKDDIRSSIDVPSQWWGRNYVAAAKNCWRKGNTLHQHGVRGFVVSLLSVGEVSQPRGELIPLSRHTHNMKGGPLNVMKVAGRST